MAKGKKKSPDQGNNDTSAPDQTSGRAPTNGQPKSKGSLLKTVLPGILGSTLVAAAAIAVLYTLVLQESGRESQAAFAQAKAGDYIHSFTQQALTLQKVLAATADSDSIRTPLAARDNEAIELAERMLEQQLPDVSNVEIYLRGKARKDNDSSPPVSFAQLDLISRAEKRESPHPEVHPHGNSRYLTLAAPVMDGGRVLGSVFATFDLNLLTGQLANVENDWGFLELTQKFSNNDELVFYSSGSQSAKSQPAAIAEGAVGHWQARFYPSTAANIPARKATLFLTIGGGAVLLVLAFSFVTFLLVKNALTQNASLLAKHFSGLTSHEKTSMTYTLEIFTSLAQTLERLFREYDASVRHQALKSRDMGSHSSSVGVTPPKDDVLDIDINDDDSSLFEGDDSHDPLAFDDDDQPDAMDLDVVEMANTDGEPTPLHSARSVPAEIFRAYDIRGIVGQNLDESIANSIGLAIGSEAISQGQTAVIVARDGRNSSAELAEAMVNGLIATGVKVIDIGMLPTPVLYYATKTLDTQSGVMITGSHNPPEYNGFKIVIADQTLSRDQIQGLRERIETGNLNKGDGTYETHDIAQDYADRILNDVVLAKPMKVVIDCSNGVTGMMATDIFNNLGCMVTTLNGEVDGDFPGHPPDPGNPDNLQQLIQTVQNQGAEIGIAFDGDGDRLAVVTGSGKIIWPDRLLMLYARDLLSRNPGSDIIYDVKCSRDVAELVSNLGGRAIMNPSGHSLMKAKMVETGAAVGGELSGHIFFNDRWYGFDDGVYSAARLLEVLSMEPVGVEEVFAELPEKLSTPEIAIPVGEDKKFTLMKRLSEQAQFNDGNMVTLDGIRVDYPDGWGLVRASNTSPNLVARFEADDEAALERIKAVFRDQIKSVDGSLDVNF
ncbi:MAG: phosphomannomutase/phosphoglucomutase [Ketobacteraceae bacterium]|nr:phosphomannomutase/phosphoglucomutase [Ketobacteraceae bacterium]